MHGQSSVPPALQTSQRHVGDGKILKAPGNPRACDHWALKHRETGELILDTWWGWSHLAQFSGFEQRIVKTGNLRKEVKWWHSPRLPQPSPSLPGLVSFILENKQVIQYDLPHHRTHSQRGCDPRLPDSLSMWGLLYKWLLMNICDLTPVKGTYLNNTCLTESYIIWPSHFWGINRTTCSFMAIFHRPENWGLRKWNRDFKRARLGKIHRWSALRKVRQKWK